MVDALVEAVSPTGWHADRPCALCSHVGDDHSPALGDACTACDCIGYARWRRPNPSGPQPRRRRWRRAR